LRKMKLNNDKLHWSQCVAIFHVSVVQHSGKFLRKMKLNNDKLHWSQCASKISCECGTEHICKTGRPFGVRIREHKYNLRQGHLTNLN
jgi:hypothetical protein